MFAVDTSKDPHVELRVLKQPTTLSSVEDEEKVETPVLGLGSESVCTFGGGRRRKGGDPGPGILL